VYDFEDHPMGDWAIVLSKQARIHESEPTSLEPLKVGLDPRCHPVVVEVSPLVEAKVFLYEGIAEVGRFVAALESRLTPDQLGEPCRATAWNGEDKDVGQPVRAMQVRYLFD
jgi:hypothetical protein